jgi:hypothetical protein
MTSLTLVTGAHADARLATAATVTAHNAGAADLPVLATANDVRELIQYLKKQPHGVDVSEIAQPIRKRVFFPPKIAAYEYWGLVTRNGERLTLTQFGWAFAQRLDPEATAYRALLDATPAYRAALHRLHTQGLSVVTHEEVIACWRTDLSDELNDAAPAVMRASVVCFFHLCQAAELGTMTLGKRGQPTRLRLLRPELKRYLESTSTDTHHAPTTATTRDLTTAAARPTESVGMGADDSATSPASLRVYVSHPAGATVIAQLAETLNLAGVPYCLAERGARQRTLPSARMLAEMRACNTGIVVLSPDDFSNAPAVAGSTLDEQVLSDIGAAFVCFDGRLLLLHEESLPLPAALQSFQCTFRGDELTWAGGIKLMQALQNFARAARNVSTAACR